jgi:hypothetical protein
MAELTVPAGLRGKGAPPNHPSPAGSLGGPGPSTVGAPSPLRHVTHHAASTGDLS